jgi:hypothetical protein
VAEEKKQHEKSLEMRVAELEDKLAKLHITEEEMRAFQKVSNLLGGQPAAPAEPAGAIPCVPSPQVCAVARSVGRNVSIGSPRSGCYMFECSQCAPLGWGGWGGGFGGFGS